MSFEVSKDTANSVDIILGSPNNAPTVHVVDRSNDIPFSVIKNAMGLYRPSKGEVYIIAGAIHGHTEFEFILRHEVFGHAGLRTKFGKKLNSILISVEKDFPEVSKCAEFWRRRNQEDIGKFMSKREYFLQSIEEALADMAGDKIDLFAFENLKSDRKDEIRSCWLLPETSLYNAKANFRILSILRKARKSILYGKRRHNRKFR